MMIGTFSSARDGYAGRMQTLMIDAEISIVPADESTADNAPEWRILLGNDETGIEIGAGWNRIGNRAGAYIALQIDDPTLPAPLRANLLRSTQDSHSHHLLWSRPTAAART